MNTARTTEHGPVFSILFAVSPDSLTAVRDRVVQGAESGGLLDVAYCTVDSPVGTLLLAATASGLIRVAYEREGFDSILQTIADKVSPRILLTRARLDDAARQIDEYFAGDRHIFDLPMDFALSSGFRRTVQTWLPHITYGHTATYKQVADTVGNPAAARAVGTACATNPLPVVVPCHRVLRSDGGVGSYVGGAEAKDLLLNLEQAA